MTLFNTLGLAGAVFLLAITPGPGVFITVSRALTSGFRPTLPLILGLVAGDLVFLLLAVFGLSALATAFASGFTILRYLGGLYLIWLGVSAWRTQPGPANSGSLPPLSGRHLFFNGLSVTLGNPKVILFYLGFLPTFVDLSCLSRADILIVAVVVSVILALVMACYALTASRARQLLHTPCAQKMMNRVAGTVMIGTGTLLISKTRS